MYAIVQERLLLLGHYFPNIFRQLFEREAKPGNVTRRVSLAFVVHLFRTGTSGVVRAIYFVLFCPIVCETFSDAFPGRHVLRCLGRL